LEQKDSNLIASMTLIGKKILGVFINKHSGAKSWFENWIADVEGSNWKVPQNIKNKYPNASFLANNVVIF
jgi:mRNA interferase HigB